MSGGKGREGVRGSKLGREGESEVSQTKRPYGCWCQPGSGMACCDPSGFPTQWRPDEIHLR